MITPNILRKLSEKGRVNVVKAQRLRIEESLKNAAKNGLRTLFVFNIYNENVEYFNRLGFEINKDLFPITISW